MSELATLLFRSQTAKPIRKISYLCTNIFLAHRNFCSGSQIFAIETTTMENSNKRVKLFNDESYSNGNQMVQIGESNFVITEGGFLLSQDERKDTETNKVPGTNLVSKTICEKATKCIECDKDFYKSFLRENFDEFCCDSCRNSDEKYKLITRTQALSTFPLKAHDLDEREPILKFITKRNPHSIKTQMKLYLNVQVGRRANEIWGGGDAVDEQMYLRAERSRQAANKRLAKKTEMLQKKLCNSNFLKRKHETHRHEFGAETLIDADEGVYSRTCTTCDYVEQFEKL